MTSEELHTSFSIKLVKPKDLLSQRTLLHNLNELINDVYDTHHRLTRDPDPLFNTKRIQKEEQLVQELGDDALIVLLYDNSLEGHEAKYGGLVATGAIRPWTGTLVEAVTSGNLVDGEKMAKDTSTGGQQAADASGTWDWEVSTCASVDDPKYRKTGLVTRCVEALLQDLMKKRHQNFPVGKENSKKPPIKFWVTALVDVGNHEYWLRRGYQLEGVIEKAPKGTWQSRRDFHVATLSKIVA